MASEGPCLVTGGSGFAGRYLVQELERAGAEVVAPSHEEVDLVDPAAVRAEVERVRPRRVFHLAALASVGRSWETPARVVAENQAMTANVLEAVRAAGPDARVLVASSGEVYGPPATLPLTEDAPLRPRSPYAVAKVGSELLAELYAEVHGLAVVRTRAFNHAGPGQAPDYVVATLTQQIARSLSEGAATAKLVTGDPSVARDFCDVRDVVRAYRLAIDAPPGAYNVATGRSETVAGLVELLRGIAGSDVEHEVDPARARPHDTPEVRGSAARLEEATGWRPRISLEQTLRDAVAAWETELRRPKGSVRGADPH